MSTFAANPKADHFGARRAFDTGSGQAWMYRLDSLSEAGFNIDRLPYSIRIMLEALLRGCDGFAVMPEDVINMAFL